MWTQDTQTHKTFDKMSIKYILTTQNQYISSYSSIFILNKHFFQTKNIAQNKTIAFLVADMCKCDKSAVEDGYVSRGRAWNPLKPLAQHKPPHYSSGTHTYKHTTESHEIITPDSSTFCDRESRVQYTHIWTRHVSQRDHFRSNKNVPLNPLIIIVLNLNCDCLL